MIIDNDVQAFCLGFAFDSEGENVVLIQKKRPEYQFGLLNGVGGKVEPGEFSSCPVQAMAREFHEETDVKTLSHEWKMVAVLNGEGYRIYVFTLFDNIVFNHAVTNTDEPIFKISVNGINKEPLMTHVEWIVKMALTLKNQNTKVIANMT